MALDSDTLLLFQGVKGDSLTVIHCCFSRVFKVTASEVASLKALKGTPLEYILTADTPMMMTPLGEVQIGSA